MDAIDMYFLNRIRPDSPLMPRVVFPTTASGTPAGSADPGRDVVACLLVALSAHATRADECPLHRAGDADTLGRPERDEPFVTG